MSIIFYEKKLEIVAIKLVQSGDFFFSFKFRCYLGIASHSTPWANIFLYINAHCMCAIFSKYVQQKNKNNNLILYCLIAFSRVWTQFRKQQQTARSAFMYRFDFLASGICIFDKCSLIHYTYTYTMHVNIVFYFNIFYCK